MSIPFFPGGGKILTDFLGEAKYEEKKMCVQKHKNPYFSKSGGSNAPLPLPPQMTSLGRDILVYSVF